MPINLDTTSSSRFPRLAGCLITTSLLWLMSSVAAIAQSESCSFLTHPQTFNSSDSDDRIVIGQVRGRPYVVLWTDPLEETLPAIRACVPDIFVTSSRLGPYVHIASFSNYRDAKDLADHIGASLDLNLRVIHRRRLGH